MWAAGGVYMLVTAAALTILRLVVDPTLAARELPVAAILDEVRAIWRPYVTIVIAKPSAASVRLPVVHLQFNDDERPDAGDEPRALGWIEFVDGVPSPRITVSRARARLLLARADWMGRPVTQWPETIGREALTRALARTAAHEIGHFLLRSTTHRPEGLMRARFTTVDFFDPRRERFRLTQADQALVPLGLIAES
jgi:hypothetical protein